MVCRKLCLKTRTGRDSEVVGAEDAFVALCLFFGLLLQSMVSEFPGTSGIVGDLKKRGTFLKKYSNVWHEFVETCR